MVFINNVREFFPDIIVDVGETNCAPSVRMLTFMEVLPMDGEMLQTAMS